MIVWSECSLTTAPPLSGYTILQTIGNWNGQGSNRTVNTKHQCCLIELLILHTRSGSIIQMKSITQKHHDCYKSNTKATGNWSWKQAQRGKQHPNPCIILLHYVQLRITWPSELLARCDRNFAWLARTALRLKMTLLLVISRFLIVASSTHHCNDLPNSKYNSHK